jgi:SAM-dependent methyltransferase
MTWKTEWWKTFFTDAWLEVQRETWTPGETQAEVDFIQEALGLAGPVRLLDVPCGEGRHAVELASRGYSVAGADISLPLLEDARRNAAERGLTLDLELADMRDLPWEREFDGAFSFWGSLGYFDEEGNEAFLHSIARALKPGARFVLDTHIAETILPRFEERAWRYAGDTLVLEDRSYDHEASRIDVEWTFVKGGQSETAKSSMRMYAYQELIGILKKVGFGDFIGYGSLDREPFALGAERLLLVAARRTGSQSGP